MVKAAQEIAASGVKEIVLTGVNIGDFGLRNGNREETFLDLVKALDEVRESTALESRLSNQTC
jgi:threonylcarbamoyladenosine tRNA methylthiotransferase MtaB